MTEFKYAKLRGRIREKFGTESKFAEVLGITNISLSRKLNGGTQFKSKEIKKWCVLLDIPIEEVGLYFFA